MRAALYTRVSTRDKGQETANQLHELRKLCTAQGWTIVSEYEDHESGGKADRSQFKAMMTDASKRKFDVVLFWALDRFSREGVYETHVHLKRLDVAGVRFRAWQPPSCLHPTIGVDAPLVFDLVDTWMNRPVGGCSYHVSHPGGRGYDIFPVNANEAEGRRISRFFPFGHTPDTVVVRDVEREPEAPLTLDLRKSV